MAGFLQSAGFGGMASGLMGGIFGLFAAGAQRRHESAMQQNAVQEAGKARDWEVMMRNAQRPAWMKIPEWNQGMLQGANRRLELGNVGGETGWKKRDPYSYVGENAIDELRRKLAVQSMGGES